MSQEIIDFGSYPNDANADPVRTAFQKTQNNFTELYTTLNVGGVQAVIASTGLDQDVQTGTVTLTANIANVTIQTGNSLVVGVTSNPTANSATIARGITPFVIDLASTITTTNVIATALTGTLTTAAQPNITSTGILTGLSSSGNIVAPRFRGNVIANTITADSYTAPSSNTRILYNKAGVIDGSSELTWDESTLNVLGNVSASNANLGNVARANFFTGVLTTSSQPNITSVGTLLNANTSGNFSAAGNVIATTFQGNVDADTITANAYTAPINSSPNELLYNNANVIDGTSKLTWNDTTNVFGVTGNLLTLNANLGNVATANFFTGLLTTASQPNVTSVGELIQVSVTGTANVGNLVTSGNVTVDQKVTTQDLTATGNTTTANLIAANITAGSFTGNGNGIHSLWGPSVLNVVANANYAAFAGQANNSNFAGNITIASQPNITSLGTLVGLTINGDLITNFNGSFGGVLEAANIIAEGGNISNIRGSSVVGNVASANVSYYSNITSLTYSPSRFETGVYRFAFVESGTSGIGNKVLQTNEFLNFESSEGLVTVPKLYAVFDMTSANTETGNLVVTGLTQTANILALGNANINGEVKGITFTANTVSARDITINKNLVSNTGYFISSVQIDDSITVDETVSANNVNIQSNLVVDQNSQTYNMTILGNASVGANLDTRKITVSNIANISVLNVSGQTSLAGNVTTGNLIFGSGVITGTGIITAANLSATANVVAGNVKTDNLLYANGAAWTLGGNVGNSNIATFLASFGSNTLVTTGNITAGNLSVTGNVTTGNLSVTGNVGLIATILSTGNISTTGNITGNWLLTSGSKLQSTSSDLAEYYAADQRIEPATVVEFGGTHEIRVCNSVSSTRVAGVISTDPAYAMNANLLAIWSMPLALQGRVPTKVIGPIQKGDMMVSAGNGHAKASSAPQIGTIIGKSLEDFDGAEGIIEIAVGRL